MIKIKQKPRTRVHFNTGTKIHKTKKGKGSYRRRRYRIDGKER